MPLVPFDSLPDDARVWVFGSANRLSDDSAAEMLDSVDRYLERWAAHGAPLSSARDWRDGRFLTIAVDQRTAGASGCSIDGLYRELRALESRLGGALVPGGCVYFRTPAGRTEAVSREEFARLASDGAVTPETTVFDPTVQTLGEWRSRFETRVADSWHAALL